MEELENGHYRDGADGAGAGLVRLELCVTPKADSASVPDEIRNRHEPMQVDDYILCARCDEIWPCDAAQLIAIIEEAS